MRRTWFSTHTFAPLAGSSLRDTSVGCGALSMEHTVASGRQLPRHMGQDEPLCFSFSVLAIIIKPRAPSKYVQKRLGIRGYRVLYHTSHYNTYSVFYIPLWRVYHSLVIGNRRPGTRHVLYRRACEQDLHVPVLQSLFYTPVITHAY